jgi:hypothetical protein
MLTIIADGQKLLLFVNILTENNIKGQQIPANIHVHVQENGSMDAVT